MRVAVEVNAAVVQGSIAFLPGETCRERSGQESAEAIVVGETSRSTNEHSKIAGGLTQRRAEPYGSVLTAGQTPQPTTPDGEAWTRAGSMGAGAKRRQPAIGCPEGGRSPATMWMLRTGFGSLLTRACPASERNRTHGGVGPVAGSPSQSRGPDSTS